MDKATYLIGNSTVTVGKYTYGHNSMTVHQWNEGYSLTIGSYCSMGGNTTIYLGGNHRSDWITTFPFGHVASIPVGPIEGHPVSNGDVVIGNDVWIGTNVTIMSGITIGHGAIIATNAHVVKDVDPYTIVGGNPARTIKKRFTDEVIEQLLQLAWWDASEELLTQHYLQLCQPPNVENIKSLIKLIK